MAPTDGSFDPTLTPEQATSNPTVEPAAIPNYKVVDLIGRGGMGEVVLADDLRIGRQVAVKRMRSASPSADALARFLREARIQARLDHPAIVPVHELGHDADGHPYFTMKRITGTTLGVVIETKRDTQQKLLRAFVDVCLAIDFAHARGFIHRDLKPANVILGDYGEVNVLDWGLARAIGEADQPAPSDIDSIESLGGETQVGTVMGTPGYMSPEQLRGEPVGTATDIYALGAILYEILVGRAVHPKGQPAVAATLAGGKLSPAGDAPDRAIAPELDELCTQALAEAPDSRPTARALADRTQRYLDGDRDLEHRRTLAVELLATARADVESGDPVRRGNAMRTAGRALALDPASEAAAALVTKLMIEPPTRLPPALERKLAEGDLDQVGVQARLAARTLLAYITFAPVLLWMGVREWSVFVAIFVLIGAAITTALILSRRRTFPIIVALLINGVMMVLMSRLTSPLLMIPALVSGAAVSFATFPTLMMRPWIPIGVFASSLVLPLVLEATGVWASSWEIANGRFVAHPSAVDLSGTAANVFLIVGSIAIVIVMPLFVRSIAIALRASRRQLEVQAWHLGQLIPETRSRSIT